jgi:predicted RNase H-like HicB family nuclease
MLREFISAAMSEAQYEITDKPDEPFYGEIAACPGVLAIGSTLEQCRANLEDSLDGWLVLNLQLGHTLPAVNGIELQRLRGQFSPD